MNQEHTPKQGNEIDYSEMMTWPIILRFVLVLMMAPLVLFICAGRLDWPMAWILTLLMLAATGISRIIIWRRNPDLLLERARGGEHEDIASWDRVLVSSMVIFGPLLLLIVAGLDKRNGWSPELPAVLPIVGMLLVAIGYTLASWAMVANRFFSGYVRIQSERGHVVITDGPYRLVRHPGYAGGLLALLGMPIMLDSLWAYIPMLAPAIGYLIRTTLEDRWLQEQLDGYRDYAAHVRYRMLPGIW